MLFRLLGKAFDFSTVFVGRVRAAVHKTVKDTCIRALGLLKELFTTGNYSPSKPAVHAVPPQLSN